MAKTNVYVYYTESCNPRLKRFASRKAADRWVASFLKKHAGHADYWYNFTIEGQLVSATPYYGGKAVESYR